MAYQITQNQPSAIAAGARLVHLANSGGGCSCGCCDGGEQNAGQCPIAQPEFPNFFAGQLVQPVDLSGIEQRIFTHEQLRARHTIGWGIACGFRVGLDPAPAPPQIGTIATNGAIAIAGATLRIEGGYGVDRFGRDVYLAANRSFSLETLFAERDARIKKAMADPWCAIPGCQPTPPTHFCIAVRYKECPDKLVPSYAQQCGTPKTVCEPSRIREDVEIRIFGDNEFPVIPQPAGNGAGWCGLPASEQSLASAFLQLLQISSGTTDVAASAVPAAFSTLAGNVVATTAAGALVPAERVEDNCEDLLHLARPCEPCIDWPWIPLACFTRTGDTVTAPDCRVRRTIYSLQEIEALVVRMFCALVDRK